MLRPLAELAPEVVTAAQLMAVADQAIEAFAGEWIGLKRELIALMWYRYFVVFAYFLCLCIGLAKAQSHLAAHSKKYGV